MLGKSHQTTKAEVALSLGIAIIEPNKNRINSPQEEELKKIKDDLIASHDLLASEVSQENKRHKKTEPDHSNEDLVNMDTDHIAIESTIPSPSPVGREKQDDEDLPRQTSITSPVNQEDDGLNYTNSNLPITYGRTLPTVVTTRQASSKADEEDEDSDMDLSSNGEYASKNRYDILGTGDVSKRDSYLKPSKKKSFNEIKEEQKQRLAAEKATRLVKQAAGAAAGKRRLEANYEKHAPKEQGTSTPSILCPDLPDPPSVVTPVGVPHSAFHNIMCQITAGPFVLHLHISKKDEILNRLLCTASHMKSSKSIADARSRIHNHIASELQFEVRLDPACVNVAFTSGPQLDSGYRAELQASAALESKLTVSSTRLLGTSPPAQTFKEEHLFPHIMAKLQLPGHAASEFGAIDKEVLKVLAHHNTRLESSLQYCPARIAVPTASMGFITTLFARVGTTYCLMYSTHLIDQGGPSLTQPMGSRTMIKDPTIPQLLHLLQSGTIMAFVPDLPVNTIEDLDPYATGHFVWLGSRAEAPLPAWNETITNLTSNVMSILLQTPELTQLALMDKESAFLALNTSFPLPSMGPPASIFIHNFPTSMTRHTPEMRALAVAEVYHINAAYDLGIDEDQIEQKITAGAWVGGLDFKAIDNKTTGKSTKEDRSKGMIFPLLDSAAGGEGRFRDCIGTHRLSARKERGQEIEVTTTYSTSKFATTHTGRVLNPQTVCIVRVCPGNIDMNAVQCYAIRAFFHKEYHCNIILLAFSFLHKIVEKEKTFYTEQAMQVLLEEDNDFLSLRSSIRNDLYGPSTTNASVIRSWGGIEFELAQSPSVLLDQLPISGPNGARTLFCPHMTCTIAPSVTKASLCQMLLTTFPSHYIKGVFLVPYTDATQEYSDWVVTVSPLFSEADREAFWEVLASAPPEGEVEETSPSVKLNRTLDNPEEYPYYQLRDSKRNQPSKFTTSKLTRTSKSSSSISSQKTNDLSSKSHRLAPTPLIKIEKSKSSVLTTQDRSPASSLNTRSSKGMYVTSDQLTKFQASLQADSRQFATAQLMEERTSRLASEAAHREEAMRQAEAIQSMASSVSAIKEVLVTAGEREQESKNTVAHLQDSFSLLTAMQHASMLREEEREREKLEDKRLLAEQRIRDQERQDRLDENNRKQMELLAALTAKVHLGGPSTTANPHSSS